MNITLTQSEILLIVKKHLESKNMEVDVENIQLAPAGAEVVAKATDVKFKQHQHTTIDGNRIFWNGNKNILPLGVKTPYIEKESIQPEMLFNTNKDVETPGSIQAHTISTSDLFNTSDESKLSQESPKENTESSIKVNGGTFSISPSATEQIADTLSSAYEFFKPHMTDAEKTIKSLAQVAELVSKSKQPGK